MVNLSILKSPDDNSDEYLCHEFFSIQTLKSLVQMFFPKFNSPVNPPCTGTCCKLLQNYDHRAFYPLSQLQKNNINYKCHLLKIFFIYLCLPANTIPF